jgi:hypothetical protein
VKDGVLEGIAEIHYTNGSKYEG